MRVHRVARLETWGGPRKRVPVVVGYDLIGNCGCHIKEAARLDCSEPEPCLDFNPCARHQREINALIVSYRDDAYKLAELGVESPDGQRPLHDVLVERFGEAIR